MISQNQHQSRRIVADDWVPVFLDLLKEGKQLRISPNGYSMYPFLRSNQDEVILSLPVRAFVKGDVVLYRRDNGLHVLHRIHHINSKGYYMLGDSQSEIEGPLQREQIFAIMIGFVRNGKITLVSNKKYRIFAYIWLKLRWIRRPIIHVFHWIRQVTHTAK